MVWRAEQLLFSRLDQFLVYEGVESHFIGVIQRILSKFVSDHSPALLDGGGFRNGPSPFRFEKMWLRVEKVS